MRYFSLFLAAVAGLTTFAQASFDPIQRGDQHQVQLNLTSVENDRLYVQFIPAIATQDSVEFHMPRIIPGTYDVHNYGRFVSSFKAEDASGKSLRVKKLDQNRWRIYQARKLYRISYFVEDTYDYPEDTDIFQPAGTSLKVDTVFLLNNFGFIGYVDQYQKLPFELSILKPDHLYGSTSLKSLERGANLDRFEADNYFHLHDNPILYAAPDTASIRIGQAKVSVAVYAPNNSVFADTALAEIAEVLKAAATYLGGSLPVDEYAILIYCQDPSQLGMSYGALEHHTSTVLYMPEMTGKAFYQSVRDITAHEFFHIITPLNIHSQYINDFDFIQPEMSEHIWFFEGVTEYNSILVQVRSGIITPEEFLRQIREKMLSADQFNPDIPLTLASSFTLTFLKDQYLNFYQKGALAGMALDLKLRALSEGEYGLPDLLAELTQQYGPDTFFVDEQFFDLLTEMTYPQMREFFALHFEGSVAFNYRELLARAGVAYQESLMVQRLSYGNIDLGYNSKTGRLVVESVDDMDEFGRDLGFEPGDEIVEFNGEVLKITNIEEVMSRFFSETEPGDRIKVVVARKNEEGEYEEEKLKARAELIASTRKHDLRLEQEVSPEVLAMRRAWIAQ